MQSENVGGSSGAPKAVFGPRGGLKTSQSHFWSSWRPPRWHSDGKGLTSRPAWDGAGVGGRAVRALVAMGKAGDASLHLHNMLPGCPCFVGESTSIGRTAAPRIVAFRSSSRARNPRRRAHDCRISHVPLRPQPSPPCALVYEESALNSSQPGPVWSLQVASSIALFTLSEFTCTTGRQFVQDGRRI